MTDNQYLKIKEKCELTFRHKYQIFDSDVIYDSMLSIILQYKKSEQDVKNFEAWLSGAIHHHFCNYIRNKNSINKVIYDSLLIEDYSIVEEDINLIDKSLLLKQIDLLKEPYSDIIKLRFFENLSHDEISAKLKLNYATTRKYYSRALDKLSKKIKFFVTLITFLLLVL